MTRTITSTRMLIAVATVASCLALCAPAHAGSYSVTGTCGPWASWGDIGVRFTAYTACPWLYARNVGGSFNTSVGVGGGWRFDAPPATAISSFTLNGII